MNITWTGKQEFLDPTQQKSLDAKIAKVSKLLDGAGKSGKRAHMILEHHKNQYQAELTLNYLDHQLAVKHSDGDQFTAMNLAIDKLEKQILKVRDKRRDTKKGPREGWDKGAAANAIIGVDNEPPAAAAPAANGTGSPRIYRLTAGETKPMSAEEAAVEIAPRDPYLVYVNAGTNRMAVILRRPDGNFDLVEC